jgi:hypothetical protein
MSSDEIQEYIRNGIACGQSVEIIERQLRSLNVELVAPAPPIDPVSQTLADNLISAVVDNLSHSEIDTLHSFVTNQAS